MTSDDQDRRPALPSKAEQMAKLRAHHLAVRAKTAQRRAAAAVAGAVRAASAAGSMAAAGGAGTTMTCFLCAYGSTAVPKQSHPLPATTAAGPCDVLACCHTCGVCACAVHGSRYSQFVCALCSWAAVVQGATAAAPVGVPATAQAHSVGRAAAPALLGRVTTALTRVSAASRAHPQAIDSIALVAPRTGEPNLVTNL